MTHTLKDQVASEAAASRRQIRGSGLLLSGRVIALGINCLAQVLIVRYLSTSEYGAWAYALSLVLFCQAFTTLSLDQSLARFVPIYQEKRQLARLLGAIVLALGIIGATSTLFIVPFYVFSGQALRLVKDPTSLTLLLVLIFLVPLDSTDTVLEGLLAGLSSARSIFVRKYLLGPSLKIIAILLVRFASGSARWLAIGYLLASAIGLVFYFGTVVSKLRAQHILQQGIKQRIEFPATELLSFTFPVMTTVIVSLMNHSVSALLLGYFHDPTQVALYRVVYPLATLNQVVYQAFLLLFTPAAARLFAKSNFSGIHRLYWHNAVWLSTLSFPIFAVTFAFSKPLVTLLYGARYAASADVLLLISFGYFASVAIGFNAATLQVIGKVRYITVVNVLAMVANITASLLLIPRYGAIGAAAGTLGTMLLHNVLKQAALRVSGVGLPAREHWPFYSILGFCVGITVGAHVLASNGHLIASCVLAFFSVMTVLVAGVGHLQIEENFPELLRLPAIQRLVWADGMLRHLCFKALDAVMTAPRTEAPAATADLRCILTPGNAHYDRVGAAVRLLERVCPSGATPFASRLLSPEGLPFKVEQLEVVGHGAGATVYRLRTNGRDFAMKVYRPSLGHGHETACMVAKFLKEQHDRLYEWYNAELSLVPSMQFCVLQSPLLRATAAAGLQPFIPGKKSDMFLDYSSEQLCALAASHPRFAAELVWFAQRTIALSEGGDFCLDMLGRDNVVVIDSATSPRLLILDSGLFRLDEIKTHFPERLVKQQQRVEYLKQLLVRMQQGQGAGLAMPEHSAFNSGTNEAAVA